MSKQQRYFYEKMFPKKYLKLSRRVGFNRIKNLWEKTNKKLSILDVGCGFGASSEEIVKMGHKVIGLDISDSAINESRKRGLIAIKRDIEKPLSLKKYNHFDVVLLLHILEHVFDPVFLLKEIKKAMKKNSYLIIGVPNHFDLRNRFNIIFGGGIIHWGHKNYECDPSNYFHIRFFRLKDIKSLIEQNGFHIDKIQLSWCELLINTKFKIIDKLIPKIFKKLLLKLSPDLFACEFLIKVKRYKIDRQSSILVHKKVYERL